MSIQRLHDMWAIQVHRKLFMPYCYLLCGCVVQDIFIGPGCQRRAQRRANELTYGTNEQTDAL